MTAQPVDLVVHARWIVPVEPSGLVLDDHAVAVRDGRIVAVLPSADAEARFAPAHVVRLADHALLPGLVNAHTHAAMTLLRGMADDLQMMDWLQNHIWPAEGRWVGPEFVRDGTLLATAEMIRGGTTCFNDMYFFLEDAAEAVLASGMRASIGLVLLDAPTAWARDMDEYVARGRAVADLIRGQPTLGATWAPHAPYSVSDDGFTRAVALCEEMDLPLHVHVHETADEVAGSLRLHGVRPLARLARLGVVSHRLLAVHATQLEADEIDALAAAGARVIHCPEANLKLAAGFCPVARLEAAGVPVALGTDGPASNNDLDLFGEMRTAALLAKGVSGDATAVPAARALEMATLEGARALGMGDRIGSLVPGKDADLVAVDLGGVESHPVHDVVSQLVYTGGRERVSHVWVAGRALLAERRLTTLDGDELVARARRWRDRMA